LQAKFKKDKRKKIYYLPLTEKRFADFRNGNNESKWRFKRHKSKNSNIEN
jgi:hypothetical protein